MSKNLVEGSDVSRRDRLNELGGELVFSGVVFDVVHVSQSEQTLEFVLADDSVRAYPLDSEGFVWLALESRTSTLKNPILRAASGTMHPDEAPVAAAMREAREELGVYARDGQLFHESIMNLKVVNTTFHVLIKDWKFGSPQLEEGERIEPFKVHLSDIPQLVWSGRVAEDPVALALLKLHHFAGDFPR